MHLSQNLDQPWSAGSLTSSQLFSQCTLLIQVIPVCFAIWLQLDNSLMLVISKGKLVNLRVGVALLWQYCPEYTTSLHTYMLGLPRHRFLGTTMTSNKITSSKCYHVTNWVNLIPSTYNTFLFQDYKWWRQSAVKTEVSDSTETERNSQYILPTYVIPSRCLCW